MNRVKKCIYFGLLLGCYLIASDSRDVEMVEPSSLATPPSIFSDYNIIQENTFDDCPSKCIDVCKSNRIVQGAIALTVCAGIGLGFGLGYAPHTYRVYNRDSDTIYVHYQPGCTDKVNGKMRDVDCVKKLYSGNHAVVHSAGYLTKLCARNDWDNSWSQNCATDKGTERDYTWNVHNHHGDLYFGRGKYQSKYKFDNSTASADIYEDYLKIKPSLRGAIQK